MADLTVLSPSNPVPFYPVMSRSQFSTYNIAGGSPSRVNLTPPPASPQRSRSRSRSRTTTVPKPMQLDFDGSGDEEDDGQKFTAGPSERSQEEVVASSSTPPPPRNTIMSPMPRTGTATRHQPTRSRSAPPERTHSSRRDSSPSFDGLLKPNQHTGEYLVPRPRRMSTTPIAPVYTSWSFGGQTRGGELIKPPPPLHRPTTFWRRTPRSGVTSSSYSPSTHLIRRSTFIAAGLPFDRPVADLSALGVESRVKSEVKGQSREVFWEVIV